MKKRLLFKYLTLSAFVLCAFSCTNNETGSNNSALDSLESRYKLGGTSEILSAIKQNADIVTTEVKLRKVAIYDSSKSEKFKWTDPSTWKYGDRKCIIPVDVTVKYGYDLRDIKLDDVKLTDDSTAVVLMLPKPKIIDAGYNTEIEEGSAVCISTGIRQPIGHELQEQIRRKAYEEVMKEDFTSLLKSDIENNAKVLLESIIKSLGWKNVNIVTYGK